MLLFPPLSFETKDAGLFFLLCSSTPGSITSLDNRSKFVWHQRVSQVQKKRNKNIIKKERETARRSKRTSKPNNQTTAYIAQYKGKRHSFFFSFPLVFFAMPTSFSPASSLALKHISQSTVTSSSSEAPTSLALDFFYKYQSVYT